MVPAHHRLRRATAGATWTTWTGRRTSRPPSARGSVAPKASSSRMPVDGPPDLLHRRCSPPAPTPSSGVTYVVLAPEHPLVEHVTTPDCLAEPSTAYRARTRARSELERAAGRARQDAACSPAPTPSIPPTRSESRSGSPTTCWARTAPARSWRCPAHDTRDWEFATAFGLPIREVDRLAADGMRPRRTARRGVYGRRLGRRLVDSGPFTGLPSDAARRAHQPTGSRSAASATRRSSTGCATGSSRASATGARRFRSSTASACGIGAGARRPAARCCCRMSRTGCRASTGRVAAGGGAVASSRRRARRAAVRRAARRTSADNFLDSAWYFLRYPSSDARRPTVRSGR